MKDKKATRDDDVPEEVIKLFGKDSLKITGNISSSSTAPTLPLPGEVSILKGNLDKRKPTPTFSSLQPEKNLRKSKIHTSIKRQLVSAFSSLQLRRNS